MIPHIKNFTPPDDSSPYNPAKTVTVPANGDKTFTLQGRGADIFGINRILPWCSAMDAVTVKAELNNERKIFGDLQLSVIRQLFKGGQLLAPYIIQKNNDLEFTLTNSTAADVDVNMQLLGFDGPALRKLIGQYKENSIDMPTPVFVYGSEEIAANATGQRVDIPTKAVDVNLQRMAVKTDDDDDVRLSLQIYNETIKQDVFVQQLNDEFSGGTRSMVPYRIEKNVPFSLIAENAGGTSRTLSFLAESYVYQ